MNFEAIRYIVRKFYSKANRKGFAKFAWWASIISIVLGVVALIVSISILDGFQSAIQENAIRFTSHIKVFTFDRKPFEQADSIVNNLIKVVPEISSAYPSVSSEVI
jgi:lipoprotein-releasing system permease protein